MAFRLLFASMSLAFFVSALLTLIVGACAEARRPGHEAYWRRLMIVFFLLCLDTLLLCLLP
jgi:hypothetical protein